MDIAAPVCLYERVNFWSLDHYSRLTRKNSSNLLFLNGCSLLHSQQGQSHHERWVGQTRRVQDEIGIARHLTMADDQRARVVANQHLLARQQSRVEVCGHGKRGSPQMVDAISHALKQIPTRRAE